MLSETKKPNRLIHEKSPYLLQHAYNPVGWYPWGEEAFARAKEEDKPIFLSIGYSTCHWCHVMERESFEDEAVAKALSDSFISIKVDREERPDVDNIYMNACHAMTGSGGWPLSIFMDSGQNPFFTGTYFPKESFLSLLQQLSFAWKSRRDDIDGQAAHIASVIAKDHVQEGVLDDTLPEKAFLQLLRMYDEKYGGFGSAPKFPSPHILMFLLRYCSRDTRARPLVVNTLDAYRNRGLFDQIGFGFYRYSTDRQIRIPHFEKMLYDNALLCITYAEAYALTGEKRFAKTAREVISYLENDLSNGDGGFYTAEDADSEGVEGKFYLFDKGEIESALKEDAEEFIRIFPVTEHGNFDGKNHLYIADRQLMDSKKEFVNECRTKLLKIRNTRERPLRDEKILTGQNGMALAALAVTGRLLGDPVIIEQARKTEAFIHEKLTDVSGELTSCIIDGKKGQPGFADDYVFCIYGLLELYFATGENRYWKRATRLNEKFLSDFTSPEGGFYQTGKNAERLIARTRDIYDGAVPSSNAVAVHNLLRLSRLSHDDKLLDTAKTALKAFMGTISDSPVSYCFSLIDLLLLSHEGADVVLVGESLKDTDGLRKAIPYFKCAVIRTIEGENPDYPQSDGKPAAYVCANKQCFPPATGAEELKDLFATV